MLESTLGAVIPQKSASTVSTLARTGAQLPSVDTDLALGMEALGGFSRARLHVITILCDIAPGSERCGLAAITAYLYRQSGDDRSAYEGEGSGLTM